MAARIAARRLTGWVEPEHAFLALRLGAEASFWLDASRVEPGMARFSFLGAVDRELGRHIRYRSATREISIREGGQWRSQRESLFDFLAAEVPGPTLADVPFAFHGGLVGYFGYECKAECGAGSAYLSDLPDAAFLQVDTFAAFDHELREVWIISRDEAALEALESKMLNAGSGLALAPVGGDWHFEMSIAPGDYKRAIGRCQQWIREGESYELCLTNRLTVTGDHELDPLYLYRHLRRTNPAPYAAFLDFGDFVVLSSSPERFLQISDDGSVESKPIKGTRRRGLTPEEDTALVAELAGSVKDRAENLMITDLLRNDLGRVCRIGSVHVPKLMQVETYETVHQLVSTIRGKLRPELTALDCAKAAFPGGSMTGAPKLRTMSLLDELERSPRGPYSGAIGYLSTSGAADLSIAIRTIVAECAPRQTKLQLGAGGAIVALSDADEEFEETLLKLRAQLLAVVLAVAGPLAEPQAIVDALIQSLRSNGKARFSRVGTRDTLTP